MQSQAPDEQPEPAPPPASQQPHRCPHDDDPSAAMLTAAESGWATTLRFGLLDAVHGLTRRRRWGGLGVGALVAAAAVAKSQGWL